MKKITCTTAILLATSLIAFSQEHTKVDLPIDTATNKISFTNVIEKPNLKKDALFELLRTWASTTSTIKEKMTTVADKDNGEITLSCKDLLLYNDGEFSTNFCYINYSITFYVKDEKFKYIIRNFNHQGCQRGSGYGEMKSIGDLENILIADSKNRGFYDNVLKLTKQQVEKVIASIIAYTNTGKNERDF